MSQTFIRQLKFKSLTREEALEHNTEILERQKFEYKMTKLTKKI